jgi:hypothetical protein
MSAYRSRSDEAGQIPLRIFSRRERGRASCVTRIRRAPVSTRSSLRVERMRKIRERSPDENWRKRKTHCAGAGSGDSVTTSQSLAGGLMDSAKERRAARRFSMMLPLKVRFSKEDDVLEKQGETRDVSFRGLYFLIEAHVEAGTPIEFVLTLPQQITLAGDVHIRCYARVLRVEPQDQRRGVAARIDRYEFLPASA